MQRDYPFRSWLLVVVAWSVYTDLAVGRKGPVVELAFDGVARDLIRELPLESNALGTNYDAGDGQGLHHYPGFDFTS